MARACRPINNNLTTTWQQFDNDLLSDYSQFGNNLMIAGQDIGYRFVTALASFGIGSEKKRFLQHETCLIYNDGETSCNSNCIDGDK